jgi:hypothetical protein
MVALESANLTQEVPVNPALFSESKAVEPAEAWRHCALVPDGPGGSWKGGEFERIEAKNRAALAAHFAELEAAELEADGKFTGPQWRQTISPHGTKRPITAEPITDWLPDDLSIPEFLRRESTA